MIDTEREQEIKRAAQLEIIKRLREMFSKKTSRTITKVQVQNILDTVADYVESNKG